MGQQRTAGCPQGHLSTLAQATSDAAPAAERPAELDLKAFTLPQLRSAIRRNEVSFPSQMPFLTPRINENQWRLAHLYFVAGWSLRALGKRYNLAFWWAGKLVHEWVERAIALGYVQEIPPEEPLQAIGSHKPEFELRRQPPGSTLIVNRDVAVPARSLQATPGTQRPTRHSHSEVVAALGKLDQGVCVEEICETMGITRRTFYAWKGKFGNLSGSELAELRTLREENRILRRRYDTATLLMARGVE